MSTDRCPKKTPPQLKQLVQYIGLQRDQAQLGTMGSFLSNVAHTDHNASLVAAKKAVDAFCKLNTHPMHIKEQVCDCCRKNISVDQAALFCSDTRARLAPLSNTGRGGGKGKVNVKRAAHSLALLSPLDVLDDVSQIYARAAILVRRLRFSAGRSSLSGTCHSILAAQDLEPSRN
eukprot:4374591-Pleurochrysis_carterae.AAC.1